MNAMNAYDFVHLALYAHDGAIKGKTKLQKLVYFLGTLTGSLDDLGYRPHFYGPYSADVAAGVNRLAALGFLDRSVSSFGACDESGFEIARHDYSLNEDGQALAKQKTKRYSAVWWKIQAATQKLQEAGDQGYRLLSIAAKTYFMLGEKKDRATTRQLADLANKFGWSITNDQVKEAADFLAAIDLVSFSDAS